VHYIIIIIIIIGICNTWYC